MAIAPLGGFLISSPARAEDRIERIDGSLVAGEIETIAADGKITGKELPSALAIDDLRVLGDPAFKPEIGTPGVIVHQAGGGEIRARNVTIDKELCDVDWPAGANFRIPLEGLRALNLQPAATGVGLGADAVSKAMAEPADEFDRLLVMVDKKVQSIPGFVVKLDADKVTFKWKNQDRDFARTAVHGVIFAPVGPQKKTAGQCLARIRDGSSLQGQVRSLTKDQLTLELAKDCTVVVPRTSVGAMLFYSPRLQYVSDLTPVEVENRPIVTLPRSWQKDLSVSGKPMMIGTRSFSKGLGVAARSKLTYDLEGKYTQFVSLAGIDAETGGKGDCEFVVLLDGKEIARQRVKGTDAGHALLLDVTGGRKLTLMVEAGAELDLADHADWADARLIRREGNR